MRGQGNLELEERAKIATQRIKQLYCKNAVITLEPGEIKPEITVCKKKRRNGSAYCGWCSMKYKNT